MGAPGQALYARERYEDWRVQNFPEKGIIAWTQGENNPRISQLMILPEERLRAWQRQQPLNVKPTKLSVRVDPNADKPRIVEFGSTAVRLTLDGPYTMTDKERASEERELKTRTAGGAIRYRAGSSGSYDVEIGGKWKADKGGNMTVTCTISGEGPYGPIKVSGSSYKSLTGTASILGISQASLNYSLALVEARTNAERSASVALALQGPPPLSTYREVAWNAMLADLR